MEKRRLAMSDPKAVTIYTRGIATPGGGAYGALLMCEGGRKELRGGEVGASNNRMDILAAVEALKALKRPCRVTLYSANGYLIDAMSKGWAARWREVGWLTGEGNPTAHADLWDNLLELCAVHDVTFVWLPREGIGEYAECHRLARQVINDQVRRVAEARAAPEAAPGRGHDSGGSR
jgi:ribonuclease HI